jgi:uncharacterized protein (DUF342 family)
MQNLNSLQSELHLVEEKLSSLESAISELPKRTPAYQRFNLERTRDYLKNQARFLRDLIQEAA